MKTIIFAVLMLVCVCFVGSATANPVWLGEVPPDADTSPPCITIFSPQNKTYGNSNVCLNFTVTDGESKSAPHTMIKYCWLQADWLAKNVSVFAYDEKSMIPNFHDISKALNLTDIPAGTHKITIYAVATGTYSGNGILQYYTFTIKNSASITFSITASATPTPTVPEFPILSILPLVVATPIVAIKLFKRKSL
ncbi:MAG: hypothetical protein NWE92_07890 [Candidatus Bathyarchaeota archaeon]|nr:hypothetical protein [Candidatus Bathyarchaeota archaeon]